MSDYATLQILQMNSADFLFWFCDVRMERFAMWMLKEMVKVEGFCYGLGDVKKMEERDELARGGISGALGGCQVSVFNQPI